MPSQQAGSVSAEPSIDSAFPEGGGAVGTLMRAQDWSNSPLGPPGTWPQSLRAIVTLLLHSKFPMFVAWGKDLGFLYNDPYAEILGSKHPRALGARFFDIWSEIWPDISPLIDTALAGEASYREDLPLVMNRKGYAEQTWFTFSYSPVRDESGAIVGMFCACTETTKRRQAEDALRQSRAQLEAELADAKLLQELSAQLIHESDAAALYQHIMDAAVAIMRSDFASMQMLHPERGHGGELRLLTFRGFNPEAAKFWEWVGAHSDGSTCGAALRTGRRVIAHDVEECAFMAGTDDLATYRATGIRSCQSTPLLARDGRIVGMISTHWREPFHPSERQLGLLDVVARQAADFIERSQAINSLRSSGRPARDAGQSVAAGYLLGRSGIPHPRGQSDRCPSVRRHSGPGRPRARRGHPYPLGEGLRRRDRAHLPAHLAERRAILHARARRVSGRSQHHRILRVASRSPHPA